MAVMKHHGIWEAPPRADLSNMVAKSNNHPAGPCDSFSTGKVWTTITKHLGSSIPVWLLDKHRISYIAYAPCTPTRESQCNVRLALESYWYAAHSGSQRSQCKSIQILLVRRTSHDVVFSCFVLLWRADPIGTPQIKQLFFFFGVFYL